MLDTSARYGPAQPDVAAKVIDGEAIIMNLTSGAYYSMAGTGAVAWQFLAAGHTVAEVTRALATRFEAPADRLEADLATLIADLLAEGLIVKTPDASPAGPIAAATHRTTWDTPSLEKYTDMADLLALDPPMPALGEIEQ